MKAFILMHNYGNGDSIVNIFRSSDKANEELKNNDIYNTDDLYIEEFEANNDYVYVVTYNYGNGDKLLNISNTEEEANKFKTKNQEDYSYELDIEKLSII